MTRSFRLRAGRFCRPLAIAAVGLSLIAAHPGAHTAPQPSLPAEAATQVDAATPVAAVAAFHAALAVGDTAAALALLAEDVIIFESGGVEASRAEYASHHLAADAAFGAAVQRALVSRTHGHEGNAAWVTSVETVTGTYRDRAVNSRSVETMLLRRIEGLWRIVHIHWSSRDG